MSLMGPDGQPIRDTPTLLGPTGQPIGAQPDSAGPMNGLRWGVGFLVLDGNILGVHHFTPDDVQIVDVPLNDGLPPQQWIVMRGRPRDDGSHRFVEGWGEMPGIAAGLLAARMNQDLGTVEEFAPPDEPPAPDVP